MISTAFDLIKVAIGKKEGLTYAPSNNEWNELFKFSIKHTVVGLTFQAFDKISKDGQKPPLPILYEWISRNEQIKQQNNLLNKEAARLTSLFDNIGCRTFILKGQANARLYDNPSCRQPGDIDIYVEGEREFVIEKLRELCLISNIAEYQCDEGNIASYHHIDLPKTENGITVEVHYKPSSRLNNPFNNKRLQRYLREEARHETALVEEGFYVPSFQFALVMQLAHILHHVIDEGIGMRQIIDYYYLLANTNQANRTNVSGTLRKLRLQKFASALMYVLKVVCGMSKDWMICEPDEKSGKILLERIIQGGNFGRYYQKPQGIVKRNLHMMQYRMKVIALCPNEVIWHELRNIWFVIKTIPARIKRGRLSLG